MWEEHRNISRVCRDAIKKAKGLLELNLAKDVKHNQEGFFQVCYREKEHQAKCRSAAA